MKKKKRRKLGLQNYVIYVVNLLKQETGSVFSVNHVKRDQLITGLEKCMEG